MITGVADRVPDRVTRRVYLDAFDGDAAIDLQPEEIAAHYRESVAGPGFGWLIPVRPLRVLGVTERSDVDRLSARLTPRPWLGCTEPLRLSGAVQRVPAAFVERTGWMRVFQPHAARAAARGWPVLMIGTGHEAMVTENRLPADTPGQTRDRLREAERGRAMQLRAEGVLKRLWRVPGRNATIGLYEAEDPATLHDALTSLPMWPWMDVTAEPLATHPQER
ncbi:muconolactone Delta-isomerase family protein [Amycolatopsis sp. KNN50.9b]|uniref:muconolactone Delta-isomerase family protein n=1 Tax=Amycolatopsis sp. KNN50.9b TaxID=2018303 RepID=UPI00268C6AC3